MPPVRALLCIAGAETAASGYKFFMQKETTIKRHLYENIISPHVATAFGNKEGPDAKLEPVWQADIENKKEGEFKAEGWTERG